MYEEQEMWIYFDYNENNENNERYESLFVLDKIETKEK